MSRGATLMAGPEGSFLRWRTATDGAVRQARRPMTVTSGGNTTGSSPGSTPVNDSR